MKFKSVNIGEFTFSAVGDGDSEFQFTVTGTLNKGGYSKVDGTEFLKDLEDYISRFGEERDDMVPLYDAEDELLNLKRRIISALGVSLSDRMIRLEDASKLHDFSYLITLIAHQTKSHENICRLLKKTNKKCTELSEELEDSETARKAILNLLKADTDDQDWHDIVAAITDITSDVPVYYKFKKELLKALGYNYGAAENSSNDIIINEIKYHRQNEEDLETFRNEVYKILNINKETWSDPDIYSTLKIQKERADLYTRRENLEEKVPSMIKELYDLIRTPCSDKFLEQDIKDLYDVGVVTQQMFDFLKERITALQKNEDDLFEKLEKLRRANKDAINALREELY